MQQISLLTTLVLTGLLYALPLKGVGEMDVSLASIKATRINWAQTFAQSMHGHRQANALLRSRPTDTTFGPRALAPGVSNLVAANVAVDSSNVIDNEIWVSDRTGGNARHLTTESGSLISKVKWSSEGSWISYVSEPVRAHDRSSDARLSVVEASTGVKTRVADKGAAGPQWSADGQSLLFWKRTEDQAGRWQPFRASWQNAGLTGAPQLQAVSSLLLEHPGAFSHDGLQAAGINGNHLVIEQLETHRSTEIALPLALNQEAIEWSWDAQWLYVRGHIGGIVKPTVSFAVNPASGKVITLDKSLGIIGPPANGERILITAASWVPGKGNRLLVYAQRRMEQSDRVRPAAKANAVSEQRWLIYDVNTGATDGVDGIERSEAEGSRANPTIEWGSDGRSVLIGHDVYTLDIAP